MIMTLQKFLLVLVSIFLISSCFSSVEAVETQKAKPVCHENEAFRISVLEHANGFGSDFLIHKKISNEPALPCSSKALPRDLRFPTRSNKDFLEHVAYFDRLYKNLMVLYAGTGSKREVFIIDLNTAKKIFNHVYFQDLRYDGANVYFFGAGPKGTVKDCPTLTPELVQEGGQIEPEFILNLEAMTLNKTGKIVCNNEDSPAWTN